MKNELDELLKQALTPIEEPDTRLNQNIMNQVKERENMKKRIGRRIPAAALAAAIVIGCATLTVAAGAVVKHLSMQEAAERISDPKLQEAFSGEDAVLINETQSCGGYDVTFLGMLSGKNLSKFIEKKDEKLLEDRTYIMVAVANTDGTPISEDPNYPYSNFYISPLVRGFHPLFLNIYSLNGSMQGFYENGVRYYICECDNVEMFADHGLYLCVCGDVQSGGFSDFEKAYQFDEETGIVSRNKEYKGLNALFDLPVDAAKADSKAAENYLKSDEMLAEKFLGIPRQEEESVPKPEESGFEDKFKWRYQITPENIDMYADRLEDSVQVLTPDEEGCVRYKYVDSEGNMLADGAKWRDMSFWLKEEFIIIGCGVNGDGEGKTAFINTLQKNGDGTVTYACYRVKQSVLDSE